MNLKAKKIFIVDDNAFVSELYKHHLNQMGYENTEIYLDSISALNHLIDKPEIIFLDYQMDTLNGFELLNKIKRFDPNILVVMISGQDDMNIAIDSLKYGAFDYIIKGGKELDKINEVLNRINYYLTELENNKPSILKSVRSLISKK